jgi:hypothetical protein
MRALTEQQRRYVRAMMSNPFSCPTMWCRTAGYSDRSAAAKVRAHTLSHSPKIAAAVAELSRQMLMAEGPTVGVAVMLKIAKTNGHPLQLKAAEGLLDRTGFGVQTEHRVVVDDVRRDPAVMLARVRELAAQFGIDADRLLRGEGMKALASTEAPVIEHLEDPPAEG